MRTSEEERIVLATNTTDFSVVYRDGDNVVKVLKPYVRIERILAKKAVAEAHPDLFELFSVNEKHRHIIQPYRGDVEASAEETACLQAALTARGLHSISDVGPTNIRRGKLIDFDVATEVHFDSDGAVRRRIVRL